MRSIAAVFGSGAALDVGVGVVVGAVVTAPVTVIGAVGPVGVTVVPVAVPPAWFVYVPGVVETVTLKCSMTLPLAGTAKGPLQVSVWPAIPGFAVVTPVLDPAV
jgi:hypothetical protein